MTNANATRIRASSFSDLLDCAARWEARNLLDMRSPSSGEATLGTAVHAGAALFDKREGTLKDAIDCARENIIRPREETNWNNADLSKSDAEKMAGVMTAGYCAEFKDVSWHSVERTFAPLVVSVDDVLIELTGTTDRIKQGDDGLLSVGDLKTGKAVINGDGDIDAGQYRIQLGVYELLAENEGGELMTDTPFIVGIKSTKDRPQIKVAPVYGAKDALLGTEGQPGVLQMAAVMLKSGLFPPNPRSILCSKKFCPRFDVCGFR